MVTIIYMYLTSYEHSAWEVFCYLGWWESLIKHTGFFTTLEENRCGLAIQRGFVGSFAPVHGQFDRM